MTANARCTQPSVVEIESNLSEKFINQKNQWIAKVVTRPTVTDFAEWPMLTTFDPITAC